MKTRSLSFSLTVPVLATIAAIGLVVYLLIDDLIVQRLADEFDEALYGRARLLISLTQFEEADEEEGQTEPFIELDFEPEFMPEFAPPESDEDDETSVAGPLRAEPGYFQVNLPGKIFARSATLDGSELPRSTVAEGEIHYADLRLPDGRRGRMVTVGFMPYLDEEWGEEPASRVVNLRQRYPALDYPVMTATVALGREDLDETIAFIRWTLGGGLLLLLAVSAAVILGSVHRGLRPLGGLRRSLDEIHSERLDQRLDQRPVPREVRPLTETVNRLLDRLQAGFERERLFSRNIAHELKTPIAELRSLGEVAGRWPDDPEANRAFFQDIERIALRMDLIVGNLLMMARHESGQEACRLEPTNLTAKLEETCVRFRSELADAAMELELDLPPGLNVLADPTYLEIIAGNLVSNAVHHGGSGRITVSAFEQQGKAAMRVENPANGLARDHLPHLFDKFWRRDPAATAGRNVGLGLPLVRSLSQACGWSVDANLTDDHRFRITIMNLELVDPEH